MSFQLTERLYKVPSDRVLPGDKAFKLHDTHGLPIEDTVNTLKDKGMLVDWLGFISAARKAGWKEKKISALLVSVRRNSGINEQWMETHFEVVVT